LADLPVLELLHRVLYGALSLLLNIGHQSFLNRVNKNFLLENKFIF
jgi:hypothetical protein